MKRSPGLWSVKPKQGSLFFEFSFANNLFFETLALSRSSSLNRRIERILTSEIEQVLIFVIAIFQKHDVVQTYPLAGQPGLVTDSGPDVPAAASTRQGRKRAHILVAGRDGAHSGWSSPEDALLFGRAEWLGSGPVAEDHRGIQRRGGSATTQIIPLACGSAGERPRSGASPSEPRPLGANATIRGRLSGLGVVEASGAG